MSNLRSGTLWLSVMLSVAACDAALTVRAPPEVVFTSLDLDADRVAPTATLTVELSAPPDDHGSWDDALVVVRGLPTAELLRDAESPPITPDHRTSLVAGRVVVDGNRLSFTPLQPLRPGQLHALLVSTDVRAGGLRLERPFVRAFTTGAASSGAAVPALEQPREGTAAVVRNLRQVAVRFSRPVEGVDASSLSLVGPRGPVRATVETGDCPTCYHILLGETLDERAAYRLIALPPLVDDRGLPPFAAEPAPGFFTGEELRRDAPELRALAASAGSGCLVARWATSVPASSSLCIDGACVASPALQALHELALPLAAGGTASYSVESRDESTAPAARRGPLLAPDSSPRQLTITEVLTRPHGAWPAQQFVEVHNRGARPESLAGLMLHDEASANALPDVTVPPGGYALIVPSMWLADDGQGDPPPSAGTVIARVASTRLGASGIRASGEAIALMEPDGRVVSRFSTHGLTLARGQSARRVAACDVATAYAATPGGTSTPGTN